MSEVILEDPNNEKRRACLIGIPDTTRTNAHRPLAFSRPEDLTNACLMENKKSAVLEKLEDAFEKLKDCTIEIQEAVLAALEMKEAGDDIADQIMVAMLAQAAFKNAETTMDQTQTEIIHEGLRKEDLSITEDTVNVKDVSLEERRREAEKPLYLARYE